MLARFIQRILNLAFASLLTLLGFLLGLYVFTLSATHVDPKKLYFLDNDWLADLASPGAAFIYIFAAAFILRALNSRPEREKLLQRRVLAICLVLVISLLILTANSHALRPVTLAKESLCVLENGGYYHIRKEHFVLFTLENIRLHIAFISAGIAICMGACLLASKSKNLADSVNDAA